jgi:hypothetical protein
MQMPYSWFGLVNRRFRTDKPDMSENDKTTIEGLARHLETTARSIAYIHLGVWVVGGILLGSALGGDTRTLQLAGASAYALVSGTIGWFVGQNRAASLRLQAITARREIDKQ